MIVKLLTEHHLEFLSLTGGCGGSSESTLVKMSNCWKSQSTAQFLYRIPSTLNSENIDRFQADEIVRPSSVQNVSGRLCSLNGYGLVYTCTTRTLTLYVKYVKMLYDMFPAFIFNTIKK